jgi:hypothetical protein
LIEVEFFNFCPGWSGTMICPISASQEPGFTGVSHSTYLHILLDWWLNLICAVTGYTRYKFHKHCDSKEDKNTSLWILMAPCAHAHTHGSCVVPCACTDSGSRFYPMAKVLSRKMFFPALPHRTYLFWLKCPSIVTKG